MKWVLLVQQGTWGFVMESLFREKAAPLSESLYWVGSSLGKVSCVLYIGPLDTLRAYWRAKFLSASCSDDIPRVDSLWIDEVYVTHLSRAKSMSWKFPALIMFANISWFVERRWPYLESLFWVRRCTLALWRCHKQVNLVAVDPELYFDHWWCYDPFAARCLKNNPPFFEG